ncbi:MAG: translocation/assembly module TamB domain-containing protein [Candidatus Omnitrophica bacterium]|nr:translocation/assembly module TamB domain-containing protein [Candidatus Omnitrophota bacterium]
MKKREIVLTIFAILALGGAVFMAAFIYTPWGARLVLTNTVRFFLKTSDVRWESLEGNLARGVVVRRLEIKSMRQLFPGNALRIQALSLRARDFGISGLSVTVDNGRLSLRGDEPIIFAGRFDNGVVNANVYTRNLNFSDVREVLGRFFDIPPIKGTFRGIDLFVRGKVNNPHVRGHFFIERIAQNDFTFEESPVIVSLRLFRGMFRWEVYGRMYFKKGRLKTSFAEMQVHKSSLKFVGPPPQPELDIRATAEVLRTKIDILVRGERRAPKLSLTSDPPLPKEQILLMLATGKKWEGLETMDGQKKVSPELTADFVDYLLFGGSARKVVQYLGLSDITLKADANKQGVTFSKDVSHLLGVGYGVEREVNISEPHGLTQRLEGELYLTDKMTVGVQKEFKPLLPNQPEIKETPLSNMPDDRVYMKYKTSF